MRNRHGCEKNRRKDGVFTGTVRDRGWSRIIFINITISLLTSVVLSSSHFILLFRRRTEKWWQKRLRQVTSSG